jgi:uncharacterized repeat protein (TIGR02543 family)
MENTGSSVKITATPKTGYSFTGWSGTGTSSFSGTTNPVKPSGGGRRMAAAGFYILRSLSFVP